MACLSTAAVQRRGALPYQIEAARKKKASLRKEEAAMACPVKPPSLFVKQSPVPSRRPLRCVPLMDLEAGAMESPLERTIARRNTDSTAYPGEMEEQGKASSKWASLFEAASTNRPGNSDGEPQQDQSSKDADAWFDKIFPKNINHGKDGGDGTSSSSSFTAPKLSAQQEKSIQQLQTLVKTLGVATRSPPPPARRNKPGNKMIRQLPRQGSGGGGVVDPVPFSSILKKLQSVSSSSIAPATFSPSSPGRLDGSKSSTVEEDDEEEEEDDLENEEESSQDETDSESGSENDEAGGDVLQQQEEQIVASSLSSPSIEPQRSSMIAKDQDLAKQTVVSLRSMAKARGLSGYSKMKKSDLVELLRS